MVKIINECILSILVYQIEPGFLMVKIINKMYSKHLSVSERARGFVMVKIINECILSILVYQREPVAS